MSEPAPRGPPAPASAQPRAAADAASPMRRFSDRSGGHRERSPWRSRSSSAGRSSDAFVAQRPQRVEARAASASRSRIGRGSATIVYCPLAQGDTVIDCHSLGIYRLTLLSLLSFSVIAVIFYHFFFAPPLIQQRLHEHSMWDSRSVGFTFSVKRG